MRKTFAALAFAALSTPAFANTATIYSFDEILASPEVADPSIYAHVDVVGMSNLSDYEYAGENASLVAGVTYDDRGGIYYTGEGSQPREVISGEVILHLSCNLSKKTGSGGYAGKASVAVTLEEGAEYELYAVPASKAMSVWGGQETNWYSCVPGIRKR